MFLVLLRYVKPLSEVDCHLEAHRSFVEALTASRHLLLSGRRDPRTGGVMLVRAASLQALETLLEQDPFQRAGVATYEIIAFSPTGGCLLNGV